jgi:UDP-glucose 4-epimerase
MTRVLVTGAAGFIGSHVAEHCLKLGFEVVGLDDLSGGFAENVPSGVDFRQGSVTDSTTIKELWGDEGFDYVYHLAAYAAEGLSHFIRRFNYTNNLIGSANLINESVLHGVKCFVFTSSIAVYGAGQTPMTEELTPRPEDPYGIAKYAVELDLAAAHHMFGLPYIVFRPHNVYGERQNVDDKYRNVIGIFMSQAMAGRSMTVFGDGLQTRGFTYIDDVASVIARGPLVAGSYQQVINVGADQPYTVLELAHSVARTIDVEPRIRHLPARNEVLHAFASHEKVIRLFGPAPQVPLAEGLARMANWCRKHGPGPPQTFPQIEVPINLPPSWRPEDP